MQWSTQFLPSVAASAAVAACLAPAALLTACLSWFLQRCYEPGMIFRKYYSLIFYWFRWKARSRKEPRWGLNSTGGPWYVASYAVSSARWWGWFFKPLGGCVYCQSIWVGAALYAALFASQGWPALLWWPPYCGAVYLFVSILEKPLSPHQ